MALGSRPGADGAAPGAGTGPRVLQKEERGVQAVREGDARTLPVGLSAVAGPLSASGRAAA
ncbi:hypothetical protein [Streptomyces sp. NPDC058394]|uniref:hypothetical protein n=1 Tax=Streptomyces sp. NPDC058394 TaxID=3346477 RepID=UPI0036528B49